MACYYNMVTAVAPVNIALIKYWGKKDENLILPINDSVSVTLSKSNMFARTTVSCCGFYKDDRFWLNGNEEDIQSPRISNCINEMKRIGKNKEHTALHLRICSENNFPTAAGLASSAAGFACLVEALSLLYDVEDDLSAIARQGSGSACRSMHGGFVQWLAGTKEDGSDSFAQQIAPKEHWPELRAMILVVNSSKKDISSTKGMQQTVLTSSLLQHRVSDILPQRVEAIKEAILKKDFQTFAEITMKDSNQFHAVCLDTYPPIHYMNSVSYAIIRLIHAYNDFYGTNKAAYTFDAGPNACLYLLDKDVPEILSLIKVVFPPSNEDEFIKGPDPPPTSIPKALLESVQISLMPGLIQYVINTKVGSGPKINSEIQEHLLTRDGWPFVPVPSTFQKFEI